MTVLSSPLLSSPLLINTSKVSLLLLLSVFPATSSQSPLVLLFALSLSWRYGLPQIIKVFPILNMNLTHTYVVINI